MKRSRSPALLVALMLVLPSLARAERITKHEWAKRVDGVCAYFNPRYPADPPTYAWESVMGYMGKHGTTYIKLSKRFEKQVNAIPLPVTGKMLSQRWLTLVSQQNLWSKRAVAAAWRHDLAAFQVAYNRQQERYTARKPLARALGLKVCTVG